MAEATEVTLPRDLVPVFPDACVVCEEPPDSTTKICQNSSDALASFVMPIVALFGWSRVEFPICSGCKTRFYFQRWGRMTICFSIVAATIVLAYPYFEDWDSFTRKLVVAGIAMLALIPYIIFEIFVPPSFTTTARKTTTVYEFSSYDIGYEFYELNQEEYPHDRITIDVV